MLCALKQGTQGIVALIGAVDHCLRSVNTLCTCLSFNSVLSFGSLSTAYALISREMQIQRVSLHDIISSSGGQVILCRDTSAASSPSLLLRWLSFACLTAPGVGDGQGGRGGKRTGWSRRRQAAAASCFA